MKEAKISIECGIRNRFLEYKEKKILIYGTGVVAKRLVRSLDDFCLVGCLDGTKMEGELEGLTILTWDEMKKETADVVIVATMQDHYRLIYDRIFPFCVAMDMEIVGENGENLIERYRFMPVELRTINYLSQHARLLREEICRHEAISFDLFDTLIMRTTLDPLDVFDKVEERLKKKGYYLPGFKKMRRSAELQTGGGTLEEIYQKLGQRLNLTYESCQEIMEEELFCEKECLKRREEVIALYEEAVRLGKRVCIITDMYLTSCQLDQLLKGMGITGYEKLFVSCEYGKGKGNGLFEHYKEEIQAISYLHIGDNYYTDVKSARTMGFNGYEVKSGYELLQCSSLRGLLPFALKAKEREFLGKKVYELFRDPFVLYQTCGVVSISTKAQFVSLFLLPVLECYIEGLWSTVKKKAYDGVLLGARDGYVIYKLLSDSEECGQWIYFLTSRKTVMKAMIETDEDMVQLIKFFGGHRKTEELVEKMFGCDLSQREAIFEISRKAREGYKKYWSRVGIVTNGKYLFCDLISSGTVHYGLNQLFEQQQDGYYLYKSDSAMERNLSVITAFSERIWKNNQRITNLLEMIITSPMPSIQGFDQWGEAIFDEEYRSPAQIQWVGEIQKEVIRQWKKKWNGPQSVVALDQGLIYRLLQMSEGVRFTGEMEEIYRMELVDDVKEETYHIVRKEKQL